MSAKTETMAGVAVLELLRDDDRISSAGLRKGCKIGVVVCSVDQMVLAAVWYLVMASSLVFMIVEGSLCDHELGFTYSCCA